jgi:hypothetical protein
MAALYPGWFQTLPKRGDWTGRARVLRALSLGENRQGTSFTEFNHRASTHPIVRDADHNHGLGTIQNSV